MLTRLLLRSLALGLKFTLAIIVARTLGFDAVAAYGLAVAAAVIASKLLGLGFSPELNRRLSEPDPLPAFGAMRTLCVAYGGLYLTLVATLAVATANGDAALLARVGLSTRLAWCVLLVALSEHAAFEANGWLFSLHRPRAGSLLLFVRTGAWAGVAGAGLLVGALHSIESVFALWFAANTCVVVLSWRRIGAVARQAHDRPQATRAPAVRERGVLSIWRHGLPFYVAGIVLASLQYAERFIGGGHLSADALGRYVFAWSIANAIQALAFSTVVVTAGPRFVRVLSDAPGTFPGSPCARRWPAWPSPRSRGPRSLRCIVTCSRLRTSPRAPGRSHCSPHCSCRSCCAARRTCCGRPRSRCVPAAPRCCR